MSRTKVFLNLGDDLGWNLFRTDLKGHGSVRAGEEFTARELWPNGTNKLMEGGRRLLVRVVAISNPPLNVLDVVILRNLTPEPIPKKGLFA